MAKLSRVLLNLFGGTGPNDDFAKFGSQTAGTPVKTKNVATIQTLAAWGNGWKDAIVSANKAPFLEDMNAVMYVHSYMTAYLYQEGIPEYDSATTYFIGSIVKKPSTSELYASLTDNNTSNPLPNQTDNANWHFLSTAAIAAGNTASRPPTPITGFVYLNTEVHSIQRFNGGSYDDIAVVPDATITATQLATSVAGAGLSGGGGTALSVNVDNSTIEINADILRIKASGVTETQLNVSVAGNGLAGGAGTPLSVNVDNSTIEISGDSLRVKDLGITTAKIAAGAVEQVRNSTNVAGGGGPVWANNLVAIQSIAVQAGSSVMIFANASQGGVATGAGRLDIDMAVFRSPTLSGGTITGGVLIEGAFSRISEIGIGASQSRLMNMSLVGIDKNLTAGTKQYALGAGISNGQGSGFNVVFEHLLLVELKKADVA